MTERDIPEVVRLSRDYPETAWSEAIFLKEIYHTNSISIVTELDNQIVGYLCARVVIDECHLQNISVRHDYRQKGIATSLLEELLRRLEPFNVTNIFLEVRKGNEKALGLYKKFGFRTIAIRKGYYTNPVEEGLLMLKQL